MEFSHKVVADHARAVGATVSHAATNRIEFTPDQLHAFAERLLAQRADPIDSELAMWATFDGSWPGLRTLFDPVQLEAQRQDPAYGWDKIRTSRPRRESLAGVDDKDMAAIRLRGLCDKLGLAKAIPEDDHDLTESLFSVLGMVRRHVELALADAYCWRILTTRCVMTWMGSAGYGGDEGDYRHCTINFWSHRGKNYDWGRYRQSQTEARTLLQGMVAAASAHYAVNRFEGAGHV